MKTKKREFKTQLITLSLVLTTFLSSFSVVRAAYAFSPQYFSFTHGSVSIGTYIEEANTTTATSFDIATVCSADFDKYYSGTVTLKWTYNSSNYQQNITLWSIVVVGGKIDSMTSGTLVIRVYDQDSFQVIMHYYAGNLTSIPSDDPGFNFTGATSSLTAVTNHNDEYDNIKSIDTRIQGLNTNLVDLIGKAQTCSGYLSDISSFVDGVEGYLAKEYNGTYDSDVEQLLNTIKTQQQTTNSNLNGVSSAITSLNSYLGTVIGSWNIQDPPMNIIEALNSIAGDMASAESELNNIYTQIQSINNNVSNINSLLTTMQQDLSSLLSTVQGIDNLIDNITFINASDFIGVTNDFNNYVTVAGQVSNEYYYQFDKYSFSFDDGKLYRIKLPVNPYTDNTGKIKLYYRNSNGVIASLDNLYNVVILPNRSIVEIYFWSSSYSSLYGNQEVLVNFTSSVSYYYYNQRNLAKFEYIDKNDIEYWNLMNYFQQLNQYSIVNNFDLSLMNKLNDVIDAINNIQVTVNVTDQEINNITNNFDNDIVIIHNIENNYGLNFDSWDDQLTSNDIALDLQPYNATINLFKTNITSLWSSPIVSMPIILSCLVFVFLVILG